MKILTKGIVQQIIQKFFNVLNLRWSVDSQKLIMKKIKLK